MILNKSKMNIIKGQFGITQILQRSSIPKPATGQVLFFGTQYSIADPKKYLTKSNFVHSKNIFINRIN